jgi:hypothetical protein
MKFAIEQIQERLADLEGVPEQPQPQPQEPDKWE